MNPSSHLDRLIAALCVVALLAAQVLGLHHHRHIEFGADAHRHAVELHFEDAGIHPGEMRAEHRHDVGGAETSHGHLDIESSAVEPGSTKLFLDLILPLLTAIVILLLLPRSSAAATRPPQPTPQRRRPRYALGPPSQAPPQSLVAV